MHTSKKIYSFELSRDDKGHIALKAQQWPWSVLQAITCTPDDFDTVMAKCEARGGLVARHSTDRHSVSFTSAAVTLTADTPSGVSPYTVRRRPMSFAKP